ncbi:MAG: hypothetical protein JRN37_10140 [Nitrososphaerota archaeon]|jgi:hypothetical protein|nr:hypothetical protein [Nitrososphaerota archaeon]MDG7040898.1 hypothetical protein [Nitrososphaerota archaeon]MDG7046659.1 hypothetical protein [Nitrososphaerota archaeon]
MRRGKAIARALSDSEILWTRRGQTARMIGLGRRQMQRMVKRFRQENKPPFEFGAVPPLVVRIIMGAGSCHTRDMRLR